MTRGPDAQPGTSEVGPAAVERERRRVAVSAAAHSTEMEGGRVSAAAASDLESYVDGELSAEDLVVRAKERMYAAGVARPVVGD